MSKELEALVQQAIAAMNHLRFQDALALWTQAHMIVPLPSFRIHEAMCWRQLGNLERAMAVLKPLLDEPTYPALTAAIAAQCYWQMDDPAQADHYLSEGLRLLSTEGQNSPQSIETAQELMLAAGMMNQHTTVTKIFRSTPKRSTTVLLYGATAYFNRGFFGEARRLWKKLDEELAVAFMAVSKWIIEGIVPPFFLEYDFDWSPFIKDPTDDAVEEALGERPLSGMVRVQLVYQMLNADNAAHQRWDTAALLFDDASPWQEELGKRLLRASWIEQPLRKRILQQLVANGQLAADQPLSWWQYGRVSKVTPQALQVLTKHQCIDHTEQALNHMLAGREATALSLLEKAYRWMPGDAVIGLALVECLHVLGETQRAKGLFRTLGQYWVGNETFHRDASLVAEFMDDHSMRRHHIASLSQLRESALEPNVH